MVKHLFALSVVVIILSACDDGAPPKRVFPKGRVPIIAEKHFPKDKELPIDIPPAPAPYTGPKKYCFAMEIAGNDHTQMQFILDDNDSIHGRLDHSFDHRQAIHGTVVGIREGEVLELNYTYADSGMTKKEELILKMKDDKIFKKNGPMVLDENGVLVIENHRLSKFELFLQQTDCK